MHRIMPAASASWSAGDARQWGAERGNNGSLQSGGILGDMPSSRMPGHSHVAAQPQPPRHAPNFRGGRPASGAPRPQSIEARLGSGTGTASGNASAGALSGGRAPGTPERTQHRSSPRKKVIKCSEYTKRTPMRARTRASACREFHSPI